LKEMRTGELSDEVSKSHDHRPGRWSWLNW